MKNILEKIDRFQKLVSSSTNTPPEWKLNNIKILETENLSLRKFKNGHGSPIFIIPPNSGQHANIVENLIELCTKYDRPVYTIDWKSVNHGGHYGINEMISDIYNCIATINRAVHLFTFCQGAWAGAIYTSLYPYNVESYTNAAGPINFDDKDSKIKAYCDLLPMGIFEYSVKLNNNVQSGENQRLGFESLKTPERYIGEFVELWKYILEEDEDKIRKWKALKEWHENTLNLDGKWYLETIKKLFKENQLIKNELIVHDRIVDLSNIYCPVFLLAGGKDEVILPNQVFCLKDIVNGAVEEFYIENSGHIGILTNNEALEYWNAILQKI